MPRLVTELESYHDDVGVNQDYYEREKFHLGDWNFARGYEWEDRNVQEAGVLVERNCPSENFHPPGLVFGLLYGEHTVLGLESLKIAADKYGDFTRLSQMFDRSTPEYRYKTILWTHLRRFENNLLKEISFWTLSLEAKSNERSINLTQKPVEWGSTRREDLFLLESGLRVMVLLVAHLYDPRQDAPSHQTNTKEHLLNYLEIFRQSTPTYSSTHPKMWISFAAEDSDV